MIPFESVLEVLELFVEVVDAVRGLVLGGGRVWSVDELVYFLPGHCGWVSNNYSIIGGG